MSGRWAGTKLADGNRSISRLADDFQTAPLAPQWATFADPGFTVTQTGGMLTTVAQAGVTGSAGMTSGTFDLTGDVAAVRMPNAGVQEAGLEAYPVRLEADANNRVMIVVSVSTVWAYHVVAGSITTVNSIAYNPAVHVWFRIRETAGTTFWETSTDGQAWADYASAANPIDLRALTFRHMMVVFLSLGTSKTVELDRVGMM